MDSMPARYCVWSKGKHVRVDPQPNQLSFDDAPTATVKVSPPPRALGEQRPLSDAALRSSEIVSSYGAGDITTVVGVRSTLLAASTQAVRECGLYDAYVAALPQRYHEQVLGTLTPVWLPLEVAMAHYQALDSMALPEDQLVSIGYSVGGRLQGAYLSTLARGVKHARVNLWALSGKLGGLWDRVFEGGGMAVEKLGPKDAQVALRGLPLLQSRHFRVGFRGVIRQGIEALTNRCYVREIPARPNSDAVDFLASWV